MSVLHSEVPNAILRDSKWVRSSFLLASKNSMDKNEAFWRLQTTADQKFTSTRLGGNFTINNPPQYTRYADIRRSGLNGAVKAVGAGMVRGEELGLGRGYSEQIDDNSQQIHLQFGVPEYNGMVSFFTGFYDGDASLLASEGRGSFSYYAGRAAGAVLNVAILVAFPWLMIGYVGMAAARFFFNNPSSKYYYMRPAMELYWQRVNFITNMIGVNMGLVPRVFAGADPLVNELNTGGFSKDYNSYMHNIAPDIFRAEGGVDVYAISNKPQRMAAERRERIKAICETEMNDEARLKRMRAVLSEKVHAKPAESLDAALKRYHDGPLGNMANRRADPAGSALSSTTDIAMLKAEQTPGTETSKTDASTASEKGRASMRSKYRASTDASGNAVQEKDPGYFEQFASSYMANRQDGNQFISYRVDHTGTDSESFSSSVKESDISSKINGMSSSARNARFSFSEGNTGIGIIDEVKSSVASFISGGLDSIQMSGLLSLAGSAFVDIPKHFESASATFSTTTYTMELRTPYGNKISRFINLYVPLATLLAAALPLSTGKQSYTAPFLCKLFSRGRTQIQLGMITSLSITRGVGNMGMNQNGECLGIDISFEVTNMSSVMHAPVDSGGAMALLQPWKKVLDDDSVFTDYMAVLGNLSMDDQYYQTNKMALNLTRKREQYATAFTPAALANMLDVPWPTRYVGYLMGAFARNGERGTTGQ